MQITDAHALTHSHRALQASVIQALAGSKAHKVVTGIVPCALVSEWGHLMLQYDMPQRASEGALSLNDGLPAATGCESPSLELHIDLLPDFLRWSNGT